MKILYCAIDQTVPGTKGGSTHVQAVAEGLAARGHEVHVATRPGAQGFPAAGRGSASGAVQGAVHWHALGAPFDRPQLRLARTWAVRRLAAALQPDVVMERYHNFGGEGLLAARHVGARAVLEVNAPVIDYPGSPKQRLDRLLLVEPFRRWRDWQCRAATRLVAPTRAILPAWVPADRVHVTEWGADTDRFHPGAHQVQAHRAKAHQDSHARRDTGAPDDDTRSSQDTDAPLPFARDGRIVVLFVGAFRAWHGVHHLVRALRQIETRRQQGEAGLPDLHAVLIGDGPERARAETDAAGLRSITFTGALPHDRLPACLAAADIGVAPFDTTAHAPLSLTFYWSPLKVFEYMASGLPVVAPDIPRLRQILGAGEAGVLYDAADPEALNRALVALADPTRRATLGAAARARAVRHYSWANHCADLERALAAPPDRP